MPQGQQRWLQLMLETHRESWGNSRVRFCFWGDLTREQRLYPLRPRLEQWQSRLTRLQSDETQALLADTYQRLALQRAMSRVQAELTWLQALEGREQVPSQVP